MRQKLAEPKLPKEPEQTLTDTELQVVFAPKDDYILITKPRQIEVFPKHLLQKTETQLDANAF